MNVETRLNISGSEPDFTTTPLIAVVTRDVRNGRVLTVAWMNDEALERSVATGEIWFWSRSRETLWNKGALSGNRQRIVSIQSDCDADALLIDVEPLGPACHTGAASCFPEEGDSSASSGIDALFELLLERRQTLPADSYTAGLFRRGTNAILKKVGEEATEVVLAATTESRERLVEEVSDLTFHLLVLLAEREITPREIMQELTRRSGKAARAD
jgi:phosphoribosyl-ATP pyrophosphohydrolase/phosphoribosyl-AMP cyclohydrolase